MTDEQRKICVELETVKRMLRRIIFYSGRGFYLTLDERDDKVINMFYLTILREAYKALTMIKKCERQDDMDVHNRDKES